MTTILRALVGAGSAFALLGFIVLAPLGWTVILIAASPEKLVEAPARQTCQDFLTSWCSFVNSSFYCINCQNVLVLPEWNQMLKPA